AVESALPLDQLGPQDDRSEEDREHAHDPERHLDPPEAAGRGCLDRAEPGAAKRGRDRSAHVLEGGRHGGADVLDRGDRLHDAFVSGPSRSTARTRTLSARGLAVISTESGRSAPRFSRRTLGSAPQTHGSFGGQVHPPVAAIRKRSFTIRSSPEWYDIATQRPPGRRREIARSRESARIDSSSFTSILSAWNVLRAGCPFEVRRAGAGIAPATTSA